MIDGHRISVVIPCHNEEEGIRRVLQALPDCVDERVVVDNNCSDRTAEVARALGARVIVERRPGYGAAYKAGLPAATGEVIVTLDGDGTYPTEVIEQLAHHLLKDRLDFISGCRFPLQNPGAMYFSNKVGNWLLTLVMMLLYGRRIRDSQSGMWVFRRKILERVRLTSDGMPLSEEIKIEVIRNGMRFEEVHIPYHVRVGEVKLRKWRDGYENLLFLGGKRIGLLGGGRRVARRDPSAESTGLGE